MKKNAFDEELGEKLNMNLSKRDKSFIDLSNDRMNEWSHDRPSNDKLCEANNYH